MPVFWSALFRLECFVTTPRQVGPFHPQKTLSASGAKQALQYRH
jgi:hypothetical protein